MVEQRSTNGQQPASNGNGAAGGGVYKINLETFSVRLKSLYSHWDNRKSDLWAGADVLSIGTSPASDDLRCHFKAEEGPRSSVEGAPSGQAAIAALKHGNKASAAFLADVAVIERDALTRSAGTGIGIEFRESGSSLNAKNELVLRTGMSFNVLLGLKNLQAQTSNPKSSNYSLLLADTVIITKMGNEIATREYTQDLKDSEAFSRTSLRSDHGETNKEKAKRQSNVVEAFSKTSLRSDHGETNKEEVRSQHQAELPRQKNEETARRLAGSGSGSGDTHNSSRPSTELVAYKNVNDVPPPRGEMMIQIDQKHEAVLLPIHGDVAAPILLQ